MVSQVILYPRQHGEIPPRRVQLRQWFVTGEYNLLQIAMTPLTGYLCGSRKEACGFGSSNEPMVYSSSSCFEYVP